ncbi:MAG: hypothetical protein QXY35_04010, partial [Thermofilaceae archaeon]
MEGCECSSRPETSSFLESSGRAVDEPASAAAKQSTRRHHPSSSAGSSLAKGYHTSLPTPFKALSRTPMYAKR